MTEEPAEYRLGNDPYEDEVKEIYEKIFPHESVVPYNRNQFVSNPYFRWCASFAEAYIRSGKLGTPEEIAEFSVQLTEALIERVKDNKPNEQLNLEDE